MERGQILYYFCGLPEQKSGISDLPKKGTDKRSSDSIIQWDRQLPQRLFDVPRSFLDIEERVEKDKSGKETPADDLLFIQHRSLDFADIVAGLTWPHP